MRRCGKGDAGGEVVGVLILMDGVKRRVRGQNETVEEPFTSEDERIKALEKWFGIYLDDDEKRGISGRTSQIPVKKKTVG